MFNIAIFTVFLYWYSEVIFSLNSFTLLIAGVNTSYSINSTTYLLCFGMISCLIVFCVFAKILADARISLPFLDETSTNMSSVYMQYFAIH